LDDSTIWPSQAGTFASQRGKSKAAPGQIEPTPVTIRHVRERARSKEKS
jgi:hypothetical protein